MLYSAYVDRDLEDLREQVNDIGNFEADQELMKDLFGDIDQDKDSLISEEEVNYKILL